MWTIRFFQRWPFGNRKRISNTIQKCISKVLNDNNSRLIRIFPKENCLGDPHQVLTIAGDRDSLIKNQMSENEIYLAFWLAIHMGKAHNETINVSESVDINLKALLNNIYEYQKDRFFYTTKRRWKKIWMFYEKYKNLCVFYSGSALTSTVLPNK